MNSIKLLIVFIFFSFLSFGQNLNSSDLRGDYVVISTTGLNLRDAPSLNSNIITTIPFGTKLNVRNKETLGIDTIGSYEFKYIGNSEKHKTKIIGNWVEVKFIPLINSYGNAQTYHPLF